MDIHPVKAKDNIDLRRSPSARHRHKRTWRALSTKIILDANCNYSFYLSVVRLLFFSSLARCARASARTKPNNTTPHNTTITNLVPHRQILVLSFVILLCCAKKCKVKVRYRWSLSLLNSSICVLWRRRRSSCSEAASWDDGPWPR